MAKGSPERFGDNAFGAKEKCTRARRESPLEKIVATIRSEAQEKIDIVKTQETVVDGASIRHTLYKIRYWRLLDNGFSTVDTVPLWPEEMAHVLEVMLSELPVEKGTLVTAKIQVVSKQNEPTADLDQEE